MGAVNLGCPLMGSVHFEGLLNWGCELGGAVKGGGRLEVLIGGLLITESC